jgi:hypothetical protein
MQFNQLPTRVRREILTAFLLVIHYRVTGKLDKSRELEQALKVRARKIKNARIRAFI